jgi:3',5'-cyclic AMP phosphodiesterase CpdA
MSPVTIAYPPLLRGRGPGFWLNPHNLWAGRRRLFRQDNSNEWRYDFEQTYRTLVAPAAAIVGAATDPTARSCPFSALVGSKSTTAFRFLVLGDTGEGDHSQMGLLPLIRALNPDFMIINGDVAYPAGNLEDFDAGFFAPYHNLDIPIWAVPGNHEYYSDGHGAEFYEIFCTTLHAQRWSGAGLRLVPQPGTYWELRERGCPLVVIGIDSGQEGNLDGQGTRGQTFNPFEVQTPVDWSDRRQLQWLEWRLTLADRDNASVIVLFHIPSLVDGKRSSAIGLTRVHRLIASHSSVRLVISAHIHNYQQYSPLTFRQFLTATTGVALPPTINYIVCGNGGAGLSATGQNPGQYPAAYRFPDASQWKAYATWADKAMAKLHLNRTVVEGLVNLIDKAAGEDPDAPAYLSAVIVDVDSSGITATPVCLQNLEALINNPAIHPAIDPDVSVLEVANPLHKLSPAAVATCLRPPLVL